MKRYIFKGSVVIFMAIVLLVLGSINPALAKPFYAGKTMVFKLSSWTRPLNMASIIITSLLLSADVFMRF